MTATDELGLPGSRGRHDLQRVAGRRAGRRAASASLGHGSLGCTSAPAMTTRSCHLPARRHEAADHRAGRRRRQHPAGASASRGGSRTETPSSRAGWPAGPRSPGLPSPAREHGLDVVNWATRAPPVARSRPPSTSPPSKRDVISLSWGTNCWSRVPHSADMMRAITTAFLRVVRAGHPGIPIVVASPVVRPDAEEATNALGATLADLREAMEEAVRRPRRRPRHAHPGTRSPPARAAGRRCPPRRRRSSRARPRELGGAVAQALTGRESSAR